VPKPHPRVVHVCGKIFESTLQPLWRDNVIFWAVATLQAGVEPGSGVGFFDGSAKVFSTQITILLLSVKLEL
jgi:hypothetical protein